MTAALVIGLAVVGAILFAVLTVLARASWVMRSYRELAPLESGAPRAKIREKIDAGA